MFLINIKFHLDFSKIGYLTGLLSRPDSEKLPSKFTIRVNRLAQAGYKVGVTPPVCTTFVSDTND